jgi:hypothetical protein
VGTTPPLFSIVKASQPGSFAKSEPYRERYLLLRIMTCNIKVAARASPRYSNITGTLHTKPSESN